jgi:broad specificity phosphatase PhoE
MIKTFYLVRHTDYENPQQIFHGRLPVPLSAEGVAHAQRLGQWFQDKSISKIFSSAVLRCRQTSNLINDVIHVPIINDQRLLEDLSMMQGMLLKDWEQYDDRPFSFQAELGGELPYDVQQRMIHFWQEKVKEEQGNIIIVTHGDPGLFLKLALLGENLPAVHDMVKIRKVLAAHQYPTKGSITPIVIDGDSIQVQDLITL